jgi:hypothetical protein
MFGTIPHISFVEMLTGNPKKDLVYSIRVVVKRKDEKCRFWGYLKPRIATMRPFPKAMI